MNNMKTAIAGPSRQIIQKQIVGQPRPNDRITRSVLVGLKGGPQHLGPVLDNQTLVDLEIFSSYGEKTLFQLLDHTRTPYGQARLWQLLEHPLSNPAEIMVRQAAVQLLYENKELRTWLQDLFSGLYDEDVKIKQIWLTDVNIPRISIVEQLLRNREEGVFFEHGKTPFSSFFRHSLATFAGAILPLSVFIFCFCKFFLSAQNMSSIDRATGLTLLFSLFSGFYLLGATIWYTRQYRGEYTRKLTAIKAAMIEANRLFYLSKELEKRLAATDSELLRSNANELKSIRLERGGSFVERLKRFATLEHSASAEKNWWFRLIPLDHQFVRENHAETISSLLRVIGELDCLCSQAEAHEKLGFSFATISDRAAPLFVAKGLRHPFLEDPALNDVTLNELLRQYCVSGPNGSGKSVLMTAAIISAITTQIGMGGPYQSLRMAPFGQILTNINKSSYVSENQSNFYNEAGRLKEIEKAVKSGERVLVGLDQIFMGSTNHREAVASTIAFTDFLARRPNALSFSITHLDEVPEWVNRTNHPFIANQHMEAAIKEGRITYSHRLLPGKSDFKAAIQILKEQGFDERIIALAEKMLLEILG